MPSAKYAGYLGGAAVAAGIGVAVAVGGQATAHADAEDSTPQKPTAAAKVEKKAAKPAAKLERKVREIAATPRKFDPADAVRDLQRGFDKAKAKTQQRVAKVEQALSDRPELQTKASQTARSLRSAPRAAVTAESDLQTADSGSDAIFTNPFRADDPDPGAAEMFGPVLQVREAVRAANPIPALDPVVREGFEAGYRVSQMVPWANLPIPLLQLAAGTHGDQQLTQAAVNQLLLTLPPVAVLYYGYDQAADLLNVESAAADLKDQFFSTVWGIDFAGLLHNPGDSGLPVG